MSKIICDVCGTSYADSATQCPICGCVRAADAKTVAGDAFEAEAGENGSYTYVKGGRFSKTNVKKRGNVSTPSTPPVENETKSEKKEQKSDKGLVVAIVILLLAIIAVVVYISIRFFAPVGTDTDPTKDNNPAKPTASQPTTNENPGITKIPCTDLLVSKVTVTFDEVGDVLLLDVKPTPENTTDKIWFSSDNEAVATVNADGKIVAVGNGQAVISITCGKVTAQCRVTCEIETGENPNPPTPPTPVEEFQLNRVDFTLSKKGETWRLYNGNIPKEEITWSSNDEAVATVENGRVTGVGPGRAIITAVYKDQEYTCIVRCSFPADSGTEEPVEEIAKISHTDVTIAIGEDFTLELRDMYGKLLSVTWEADNDCCTIEGNKITGAKSGRVNVKTIYEEIEFTCIVRVKDA